MNIKNFTNNGTVNEVHDYVVAISPQGQQIQQNNVSQPQPSSPKTSSWTPTQTAPSSSAKKANNRLLTFMSTASPIILISIDENDPPPFYRMAVFSIISVAYTLSSLINFTV